MSAGTHTISFTLPAGLTLNTTTYLRARVSSNPSLNPTGYAVDGEVEDYAIKFGTPFNGIRGRFNIQRTNSALNAKDFALYTQIVGRDFNYHVVFYDENMTNEKQLVKVPVKIDLIDANRPMDAPLYTTYNYFSHTAPSSRIAILDPSDLNNIPATKEALFKITYAINANGTIAQQECDSNYKTCFESLIASSDGNRTNNAQDKFAIRPETFYIKIADGDKERMNSRTPNSKLKVASGYEYNLSMIATQYGGVSPAKGYSKDFNASFDFNNTGLINCADTSPIKQTIHYIDGIDNIPNFKHNNVGTYRLTQVTDENWTNIDKVDNDCIENNSSTSTNGDSKSGCNIALQLNPIDLVFYPDHFDVALTMKNLPNSGHNDFLYMMELNTTNNSVAIAFEGNITAQTQDNSTTKNFTAGCVATNLLLDLNATTVSVEGNNQNIHTIDGSDVNFSRVIRYNNNPNFELNNNLPRIGNIIPINANKFLDDNNGTMSLDMRYNLNKDTKKPINPIEVTFNRIDINSTEANSIAHDKINITSNTHTPKGNATFTNSVKNFYFARVVSDLNNYPRVNMTVSPLVRTPLNVDIYCRTDIPNYCKDRNVIANSNLSGTTREQNGWYLSINHNGQLDGNVTDLIPNHSNINLTPNPTPAGADDLMLDNGENGLESATFINCSNPTITVTIKTSPALAFEPSQYTVNCTNVDPSQWTGVGKTGNILSVKPKVNKSGKMDW
ncbi:hypothetical protein MNB_SV-14-447 [hydrothermal vent metagenome]|uniref:GEVED domain-containing protein n=1 Tax=hydrothermal vent metagenome TaxID=652676 RepID=A0A1W1CVX7_9ZZZZ